MVTNKYDDDDDDFPHLSSEFNALTVVIHY